MGRNDDMQDIHKWLESGHHLPEFLRDFHDQKDFFKAMHYLYQDNPSADRVPNWVDGQIYTIDWFLWMMASRGYTLQKTRKKLDFSEMPSYRSIMSQHGLMGGMVMSNKQSEAETVELKPYRQTWLSYDLLHSSPSARLFSNDSGQFAEMEHPKGGPLCCIKNRTGRYAIDIVRLNDKWCWVFSESESQ